MRSPPPGSSGESKLRILGLVGGPLLFVALLALPPPPGLTEAGWRVAATAALMVTWWITEALPLPVTALTPVAAFPLLGVIGAKEAAAPYAHPLIFLFLGGFLIARAVERWGLHRRLALGVIRGFGTRPAALIGGFMSATAILSMWLSNTATAIMMLPIGLSVIGLVSGGLGSAAGPREARNFSVGLLLAIAYGASIGGIGTLIGTPPNALLAAYLAETEGLRIGFAQWMLFGVPVAVAMLFVAWLLLTRIAFPVGAGPIPGAADLLRRELAGMGPMSRAERRLVCVVVCVAAAWATRPLIADLLPGLALSDPVIAVIGGIALFLIPANWRERRFLMDWDHAKTLPWGVLILFGGGLSLASAIQATGLAAALGELLTGCAGWPLVAVVLVVTALVVFLTEVTSNTATASVFIPIAATLGSCLGLGPAVFSLPVALAASCAFMMPIATPPNAIVFASGRLRVADMAKAGLLLNVIAIFVITGSSYWAVSWLFAESLGGP